MQDTDLGQLLDSNPLGVDTTLQDVEENFEFLEDWEDRYGYVIDLGRKPPAIPATLRTEDNQIFGCQSQVWYLAAKDPENGDMRILIDSDALIVKGLAAIVMLATNRRPAGEVASADIHGLFESLGLLSHLSPTRGNGLRAMISTVQKIAAA